MISEEKRLRRNEYRRKWAEANPAKVMANLRRHQAKKRHLRATDPAEKEKVRAQWLWYQYGLTAEAHSALWESQGRCCALCTRALPLIHKNTHVDHCHGTGRVRGILCSKCNMRIGVLEGRGEQGLWDDLEYLRSR